MLRNDFVKRLLCILGGFCWCLSGLGFGIFLLQYLTQGAGGEFLGFISLPVSFVLGWAHVLVLAALAALSFGVGMLLFARGLFPKPQPSKQSPPTS